MAFYPQFPAIYAYAPVPFPPQPNQEFYAMYPQQPAEGGVYYETAPQMTHGGHHYGNHHQHHGHSPSTRPPSVKYGFANRKDSADSGVSDFSFTSGGANSRKVSSTSTISNSSMMKDQHEESSLENVEEEEQAFEEPDDDTCEKIVQQVEFYFSDANITKDKFLLKHVKRNKEGFVSLKLISSFKRVKHLTKDWRQVAYAIERKSDKLEVNDLKTKVRRLEALPEYDETTPSRTVVALNLPLERPTIEGVAEIFSKCGDIVLVRVLRPGNPIPADIKPFANKHPEMTAKVCALIEFERTEFALKAVKELNDAEKEENMKVMELTAPPPKSTKNKESAEKKKSVVLKSQQQPQQQQQHVVIVNQPQPGRRSSYAGFGQQQEVNGQAAGFGARRKISLMPNMRFQDQHIQKQRHNSLNPNAPSFSMQHQQTYIQAPIQRRVSRPPYSVHPAYELMPAGGVAAQGPAGQAWFSRRISANGMHAVSGLALPPNVIRMPRGPEKGKNFNWRQPNKPVLVKKPSKAVPIVAPPKVVEEVEEEKKAGQPQAQPQPDPVALEGEEQIVQGAAALNVQGDDEERGSDSGHEDSGLSDSDVVAGGENERTR